jgi:putative aldouronate transport system permease protein
MNQYDRHTRVTRKSVTQAGRRDTLLWSIKHHPLLYAMVIPGIVYFIMFRIIPSLGCIIAWQKYNIFKGILGSPWVGWQNFRQMFAYADFGRIIYNTLAIGGMLIIFGFPVPIILALLLNEVRSKGVKRLIQTLIYMPHFLSWVIVGQLVYSILSPTSGIVNVAIRALGGKSIFFMAQGALFKPIAVISHIWKEAGFMSIVYIAAISGIDQTLYEAAEIDGAGRWTKMGRITLPLIMPTIVIMLLLDIGRFLEVGFDHIWNLLNSVVWSEGDILNTYIFRVGLQDGRYSLTTAIGIFKAVVGFVLLVGGNKLAEKVTGRGFFIKNIN